MNRLSLSKALIIVTIILIAAFQYYWISRLYKQERATLGRETDVLFRDVVYKLQLQRFQDDTVFFKHGKPDNLFAFDVINAVKRNADSILMKNGRKKDSNAKRIIISLQTQDFHDDNARYAEADSFNLPVLSMPPSGVPAMFKYSSANKNINDSLPLNKIDSAYTAELIKNNINIRYTLKYFSRKAADAKPPGIDRDKLKTNFTFVGLSKSYAYQAEFDAPFKYLLNKL
jgi:two-component system phosphate regulon sensor histidine kinase PhoR